MQRHRQRFGQCCMARRESDRQTEKRPGVHEHVAGEGAVVEVGVDRPLAALALRRLPFEAAPACPAARRRPTDDLVAHRPVGDTLADGPDDAGELVTADQAGLAPSLEHEVDVRSADAAVAHFHQHFARPRSGHRALLHLDRTGRAVDGHGHHIGNAAHDDAAPVRPIMCATRARWTAPEPNMAAVALTRFTYMCMSCSQV